MHWSPGFTCLSLILVLAASTTNAADCRTTFDNSCLSWSTTMLRTVDCQTAFDERCLSHHATDAEIEADALAAQRRLDALLQEQREEAAQWDLYDQQEAAWQRQAELEARLLVQDVAPATFIVFRAPVRWVSPRWSRPFLENRPVPTVN